jgi:hypothetical protein
MTRLIAFALLVVFCAGLPSTATSQSQEWLPLSEARGALSNLSDYDRVQDLSNYNVNIDTAAAPVRVQLLTIDPTTGAIEAYETEFDFTRLPVYHTDRFVIANDSQDWAVLGLRNLRQIEDGCLRTGHMVYCGYQLAGQDWITRFHTYGVVNTYLLPAPEYRSFTVHHSTGTWSQTELQHRNADARFRAMYEALQNSLN